MLLKAIDPINKTKELSPPCRTLHAFVKQRPNTHEHVRVTQSVNFKKSVSTKKRKK